MKELFQFHFILKFNSLFFIREIVNNRNFVYNFFYLTTKELVKKVEKFFLSSVSITQI
jgi:hypothetical protein